MYVAIFQNENEDSNSDAILMRMNMKWCMGMRLSILTSDVAFLVNEQYIIQIITFWWWCNAKYVVVYQNETENSNGENDVT